MEKINLNTTKMKKTSFLSKLVNLFAEGNVALMDIDSSIGMLTADSLDLGVIVYDETMQPVISAEFDFEGNHYSTDETGAISEVSSIAEEISDEEVAPAIDNVELEVAPAEPTAPEVPVTDSAIALQNKIDELQSEIDKLMTEKNALSATNLELSGVLATLRAKEISVKLGAQPRTTKEKQTETALEAISRISTKINN